MTSTACICSLCGHKGYWGRFGGSRAFYIRNSTDWGPAFVRVGWICETCLKKIEAKP